MASCLLSSPRIHSPPDSLMRRTSVTKVSENRVFQQAVKWFRQLQNLYEVISPDTFLRPFIDDYLSLVELYALIRNAYSDRLYVDREISNKTRELLQKHT